MAAPLLRHLRHAPPPRRPPSPHVFFGSAKGRPTCCPRCCPPPPPPQSSRCVRRSLGFCPCPAPQRSSLRGACAQVTCHRCSSRSVGCCAGGGGSCCSSNRPPRFLFPLFPLCYSPSILHNSGGSSGSGSSCCRLGCRGVVVRSRKGGYYKCQWALCALGTSSAAAAAASSQFPQVVALPIAVWLLHSQPVPPLACACIALALGHVIRTVSEDMSGVLRVTCDM